MSKLQVDHDNPNILKPGEIDELGLEEADDMMGPSWEDVEEALKAKNDGQGKEQ